MNEDILQQLRDIHWPAPPSIWPLAMGYYVVLAAVTIVALVLLYYFIWGRVRLQQKRSILRELSHIETSYENDPDVAHLQASVSALLRRIIFLKDPKNAERSIDLVCADGVLAKIFSDRKKTEHLVTLLSKDRFHKAPDVDGALLLKLTREQIKRCRI